MTAPTPVGRDAPRNVHVVATIVARNYAAFARVLSESVRLGHPDVDRVTLLVDGTEADRGTPGVGRVVLPGDLGLPREELEPMAVMYTVMELSTALKPALLRFLLREGYEAAAYLDPDILVKGSLDQVFTAARDHAIALTPHVLAPVPLDGLEIAERTVMQAGVFNLGFIAVGQRATAFLDWWHVRLTTQAVVDFAAGLFTDQKWIDWVPALFEHTVLRDPGLNVAYWNAHERPLTTGADGAVLAAGSPLVFVHFSGFNPATPWVLSRFTGRRPRALVSDSPTLARLCLEYASLLEDAGHAGARGTAYGFDRIGDLVQLTPSMRTVYREALLGEVPFARPPLEPLSAPHALAEWFERPARLTPWYSLTPAEYALWLSRPDLREAAPYPLSHSLPELRERLDGTGEQRRGDAGPPAGWTVLAGGSIEPAGESIDLARRLAGGLAAGGVDVELLEVAARAVGGSVRWESVREPVGPRGGNMLVCLDGGRFVEPELAQQLEGCPGLRVGVWLTSDLSEVVKHPQFLHSFDEVWVLSDALVEAVHRTSPVRVARLRVPTHGEQSRPDPGRGTGLTVLVELDARVPITLRQLDPTVGAYLDAVPDGGGHRLLVRAASGHVAPGDQELLHHVRGNRFDVEVAAEGPDASGVDVVLALDPLDGAGVRALDAVRRGATVVTGTPGAASLDGVGPGVVRLPAAEGSLPGREAVAEVLIRLVAAHDVAAVPRPSAGGGSNVALLLVATQGAGRRQDRVELRHRGTLEHEIGLLRADRDAVRGELTALEATRTVRVSRALRSGIRRAVGVAVTRLQPGTRW